MIKETKKAPTIRFRDFTDDWEQRKLEDFGRATGGTSIESEFNKEGKYKVISIGSYSENSTYTDQGIRCNLTEKTQNRILNKNDLTMILNDKTAVGRIIGRVLLIEQDNSYVYNQRTERIEPNKNKYDPLFLYEMLNAPGIRSKIVRQCQGNTQIYVNWPVIANQKYKIPELKEQKIIGFFLKDLDHLITLHQRKLDQLKTLKKYFLQNMFPAKGEKVPKIRMKGFTGNWEEWKLGDLMDVGSVKRIHQSDWRPYGIRFLRARDIIAIFKKEPVDEYLYIDEKTYEEYSSQSGKVSKGDLLVTGVGTIGVPMLVASDNPIYFKDGNIIWFKNNNKIDGNFFYYSFTAKAVQDYIRESAGIGTVGTYTIESGKKTPISLPKDIKEQREIGELFNNLNQSICLHKRKLEWFQTLKKYMLQNMFI